MTLPQAHTIQRTSSLFLLASVLGVAGCGINSPFHISRSNLRAAATITGTAHGGQQPTSGAMIELLAVGQTGDGSVATSLLTNPVTTNSNGTFTITGD